MFWLFKSSSIKLSFSWSTFFSYTTFTSFSISSSFFACPLGLSFYTEFSDFTPSFLRLRFSSNFLLFSFSSNSNYCFLLYPYFSSQNNMASFSMHWINSSKDSSLELADIFLKMVIMACFSMISRGFPSIVAVISSKSLRKMKKRYIVICNFSYYNL